MMLCLFHRDQSLAISGRDCTMQRWIMPSRPCRPSSILTSTSINTGIRQALKRIIRTEIMRTSPLADCLVCSLARMDSSSWGEQQRPCLSYRAASRPSGRCQCEGWGKIHERMSYLMSQAIWFILLVFLERKHSFGPSELEGPIRCRQIPRIEGMRRPSSEYCKSLTITLRRMYPRLFRIVPGLSMRMMGRYQYRYQVHHHVRLLVVGPWTIVQPRK